jgi:hypothetical protein
MSTELRTNQTRKGVLKDAVSTQLF